MAVNGELGFFVLVDAGEGDVHKIREELLKVDQIELVHCLIGPTDLICYGKAGSFEELHGVIRDKLATLHYDRFNPVVKTETLVSMEAFGKPLTAESFGHPERTAAWIFADISIAGAHAGEKLIAHHEEILAAHSVLGRHDTLLYVESDNLEQLMEVIDGGVRVLRGIGNEGRAAKALSHTDTRLVLMP
ncbi:hypothetical protein ACWJJH_14535 [Endozoicomonadaceae bacterium StTr2]